MQALFATPANPYPPDRGTVGDVKSVDEIRRANLLTLIDLAGSAAKLAVLTGIPAPYISQVKRAVQHSTGTKPRTIGPDMARKFETKMGKPRGWMDTDHSALSITTDLNGREGQLVGLFRLLSDTDQAALVNELTQRLRAGDSPHGDSPPAPLRH